MIAANTEVPNIIKKKKEVYCYLLHNPRYFNSKKDNSKDHSSTELKEQLSLISVRSKSDPH